MAAPSRTTRSNGFQRSLSPTARLSSSPSPPSSAFHHHRSASPTRVNLVGSNSSASAVRSQHFKRPISSPAVQRKTCMCSPTTHPGSFRCSLHKGFQAGSHHSRAATSASNRLNARRSAMTNSLVRIGTVEGELVKRALAALIRPSSHQQRRREVFQPRPSRLSTMSRAADL